VNSKALRSKVSLGVSPAVPKAQGKRVLSEKITAGELFRQAAAARLPCGSGRPQTVDKPKSTVIFHKEKRTSMSNI